MNSSDNPVAAGSDEGKPSNSTEDIRQPTGSTQPGGGGYDLRLLAIFFGLGLIFNIGFVMLVMISAEIAGTLMMAVLVVTTSVFTGYLVMQIADSVGFNLLQKIEGE